MSHDPFPLPVAGWTMLVNGALFLALTIAVIRRRRSDKIVLGDGEDRDMAKLIRAQGNAAEQMPMFLIALALAELSGANAVWLAALAALFTAGRVLHAIYFARPGTHFRFRFWGMAGTLIAMMLVLATLAVGLIR